jgi:hypothetical protein
MENMGQFKLWSKDDLYSLQVIICPHHSSANTCEKGEEKMNY